MAHTRHEKNEGWKQNETEENGRTQSYAHKHTHVHTYERAHIYENKYAYSYVIRMRSIKGEKERVGGGWELERSG